MHDARFVVEYDISNYGGVIYTGFVNGETPQTAGLTIGSVQIDPTKPLPNLNYNDLGMIGFYKDALLPSGFDAHNYSITYQNGDYSIVGTNTLLVKVNQASMTYGSTPDYGNTLTARYLKDTDGLSSIQSIPLAANNIGGRSFLTTNPTELNQDTSIPDVSINVDFAPLNPENNLSGSGKLPVGGYQVQVPVNNSNPSNPFTYISYNNQLAIDTFTKPIVSVGSLEVIPKVITISIDTLHKDSNSNVLISKIYDGSSKIDPSVINKLIDSEQPLIELNDSATIVASGNYANKNVADNISFDLSVSLSGSDRNNYALDVNPAGFVGQITQLDQVTYTGGLGGNWSNPNNWTAYKTVGGVTTSIVGAIPDYSNVRQVIIPANNGVNFDQQNVNGPMTSQIVNNGNLYLFADANTMYIQNIISGSGQVNVGGSGAVVMMNNRDDYDPQHIYSDGLVFNTYSGGTNIAANSTLHVGSNNAIGTGPVNSTYGNFGTYADVVLPSLTVNGPITLVYGVKTIADQTYNGAVLVPSSNLSYADPQLYPPYATIFESTEGNIQFMSTLNSDASKYTSLQQPSWVYIKASEAGSVKFNDSVGHPLAGASGAAIYSNNNMDNLVVVAKDIYMNADAVTLNSQTYTADNVWIGDNGTNGLIRTMLSVDPSVIVNGNINDASPQNIHSLQMLALSQSPSIIPNIEYRAVGNLSPLKDFKAVLSIQKDVFNSNLGNYDPTEKPFGDRAPQGGAIYQYKPSNVNTSFNRFADAGTLLNNISQYMRNREMQQFSEGGTLEGTVEVSVICKQNPDGSDANKDCK